MFFIEVMIWNRAHHSWYILRSTGAAVGLSDNLLWCCRPRQITRDIWWDRFRLTTTLPLALVKDDSHWISESRQWQNQEIWQDTVPRSKQWLPWFCMIRVSKWRWTALWAIEGSLTFPLCESMCLAQTETGWRCTLCFPLLSLIFSLSISLLISLYWP